jgi:CheY-like chemotaxis protein
MKKKILVVVDEKLFVDMIKMRLRSLGHEVITAYDGKEALEKIGRSKPEQAGYGISRYNDAGT